MLCIVRYTGLVKSVPSKQVIVYWTHFLDTVYIINYLGPLCMRVLNVSCRFMLRYRRMLNDPGRLC